MTLFLFSEEFFLFSITAPLEWKTSPLPLQGCLHGVTYIVKLNVLSTSVPRQLADPQQLWNKCAGNDFSFPGSTSTPWPTKQIRPFDNMGLRDIIALSLKQAYLRNMDNRG